MQFLIIILITEKYSQIQEEMRTGITLLIWKYQTQGEKKRSMRNRKKRNNINEVTLLLGVYRNVQRGLQNSATNS